EHEREHEKIKINRIKRGGLAMDADGVEEWLKEERRPLDRRDAARAVGEIYGLVQIIYQCAHDPGEAQRDGREKVAPGPQQPQPEEHSGDRPERDAADKKGEKPTGGERKVPAGDERVRLRRAEDRPEVSADRVEGDEAQVQQADETDDDVEAERERDEN